MNRIPHIRARGSVAVAAMVAAVAALTSACSSPPAAAAPPLRQSVEQSSFIGSCRGLDVGTYVFRFGPATDHRGSARITFPDPAKGTQTAARVPQLVGRRVG